MSAAQHTDASLSVLPLSDPRRTHLEDALRSMEEAVTALAMLDEGRKTDRAVTNAVNGILLILDLARGDTVDLVEIVRRCPPDVRPMAVTDGMTGERVLIGNSK